MSTPFFETLNLTLGPRRLRPLVSDDVVENVCGGAHRDARAFGDDLIRPGVGNEFRDTSGKQHGSRHRQRMAKRSENHGYPLHIHARLRRARPTVLCVFHASAVASRQDASKRYHLSRDAHNRWEQPGVELRRYNNYLTAGFAGGASSPQGNRRGPCQESTLARFAHASHSAASVLTRSGWLAARSLRSTRSTDMS